MEGGVGSRFLGFSLFFFRSFHFRHFAERKTCFFWAATAAVLGCCCLFVTTRRSSRVTTAAIRQGLKRLQKRLLFGHCFFWTGSSSHRPQLAALSTFSATKWDTSAAGDNKPKEHCRREAVESTAKNDNGAEKSSRARRKDKTTSKKIKYTQRRLHHQQTLLSPSSEPQEGLTRKKTQRLRIQQHQQQHSQVSEDSSPLEEEKQRAAVARDAKAAGFFFSSRKDCNDSSICFWEQKKVCEKEAVQQESPLSPLSGEKKVLAAQKGSRKAADTVPRRFAEEETARSTAAAESFFSTQAGTKLQQQRPIHQGANEHCPPPTTMNFTHKGSPFFQYHSPHTPFSVVLRMNDYCTNQKSGKHKAEKAKDSQKQREASSRFSEAAAWVKDNVARLSFPQQLRFYGLYKQALSGNCDVPAPLNQLDFTKAAKWKSWKANEGLSCEEAKNLYVEEADNLLSKMISSEQDKQLLNEEKGICLDNFAMGGMQSSLRRVDALDVSQLSSTGRLCREAATGNLEAIATLLEKDPSLIHSKNEAEMTALHLAADRGHLHIVQYLLNKGADANASDDCGETPLHVAVVAENTDIVKEMLKYSPDLSIRNHEGHTAVDLAKGGSDDELRQLLLRAQQQSVA